MRVPIRRPLATRKSSLPSEKRPSLKRFSLADRCPSDLPAMGGQEIEGARSRIPLVVVVIEFFVWHPPVSSSSTKALFHLPPTSLTFPACAAELSGKARVYLSPVGRSTSDGEAQQRTAHLGVNVCFASSARLLLEQSPRPLRGELRVALRCSCFESFHLMWTALEADDVDYAEDAGASPCHQYPHGPVSATASRSIVPGSHNTGYLPRPIINNFEPFATNKLPPCVTSQSPSNSCRRRTGSRLANDVRYSSLRR